MDSVDEGNYHCDATAAMREQDYKYWTAAAKTEGKHFLGRALSTNISYVYDDVIYNLQFHFFVVSLD
jgi:hypothetical protein